MSLQLYSIHNMHVCDWENMILNNMGNFLVHLYSQWIDMMGRLFNTNLYIVLKYNTVKIHLLYIALNFIIRLELCNKCEVFYLCKGKK